MDSPTATLIGILQERVANFQESGNLTEALHAANAAVEKTQQSLTTDLAAIDSFVSALEIRAELHREMGDYEAAQDDYRQAIDQLDTRPDKIAEVGRLHAGLGATYDAVGKIDKAADHWLRAISCFEAFDPPLDLDIAGLCNNLGFLYKSVGEFDHAESQFLRALEILHANYGTDHEETATVSSNLGALYQAAGYHEQAREMHMMALETRRRLLGDQHPDTAQSHNNLALALLSTGDRAWAKRHLERALEGFESLGPEYHEDLDAVADNYCLFLRDEGDNRMADLIEDRVKKTIGGGVPA
ncbi:MAG: tetratricopeptide repeat protein [Verrucomicrobiota bacterium]